MSNYHPDVRLRLLHVQVYCGYDGSVRLASSCEMIGRDGRAIGTHGHSHRLPPNRWHGLTLPQAIAEAHVAHHESLGLNPPPSLDEMPLHLHPQGYPGTQDHAPVPAPPVPPTRADHYQRLVAAVVSAKEEELNGARAEGVPLLMLDPRTHPAVHVSPAPPTSVVDVVSHPRRAPHRRHGGT